MSDVKNALYLLTMKSYLIDKVNTVDLDDNCKMVIKTDEYGDWDESGILYTITFEVNVISPTETYKVYFQKHSYSNIRQILLADDNWKWNFIFRKKISSGNTYHINMIKVPGNKMSRNMKLTILKKVSSEIDFILNKAKPVLNNNDSKKILKLKKQV